jgi:hypothetical protein
MTSIQASTRIYEDWLRRELNGELVEPDLERKHEKMRHDPFSFLRATYWRWAETILDQCSEITQAPSVLAIGDIHLENFGTWRDIDGRLIWGVNDFDEAAEMPYPVDLVRLAVSALLARGNHKISSTDICKAILTGYKRGIKDPAPIVLDRQFRWLRELLVLDEQEREEFWKKLEKCRSEKPVLPPGRYEDALKVAMPEPNLRLSISPRTAGTGSLGRPRYLGQALWRGGPVVREAKALVSSGWSLKHDSGAPVRCAEIASGRFRAPDPWYKVSESVVTRRLSPNSRKIEVKGSADVLLRPDMLDAMGLDIANIHSGDLQNRNVVMDDVRDRGTKWLVAMAKAAAKIVETEHKAWADQA